jgi:hypothetical protein
MLTRLFSDKESAMRRTAILVATLLSACASTSGVVPLGSDTYLISRSEKGFDTTGSRVKADAIKESNKYCATTGKQAELVKTTQNDMIPFKSDAQAEIEFRCIPTN